MQSNKDFWPEGLPYVNNFRIVFLTVAVNLACVLAFFCGAEVARPMIVSDACICGAVTSFIDVFAVHRLMKGLRAQGKLPSKVPHSRLMAALPQNPAALAAILAALFGVLTPLANDLLLRFYEIESLTFAQFALWRISYSTALSAYIVQIAIFRYVQPDCGDSGAPQTGASEVKNPLLRVPAFKEWLNSVTDDFGFNMALGLLLGGTVIRGKDVIIAPAALAGIHYSAIALGLIVTARMVYPVAQKTLGLGGSGAQAVQPGGRPILRLPLSPAKFALVLLPPLMAGTYVFFRAVMTFFGFETLNFFQFFVIRSIWTALLTNAVVKRAVWRCVQLSQKGEPKHV